MMTPTVQSRERTNTSDSIWSSQWAKNPSSNQTNSSDEEDDTTASFCSLLLEQQQDGILLLSSSNEEDSLLNDDEASFEEEEEMYLSVPFTSRQRRRHTDDGDDDGALNTVRPHLPRVTRQNPRHRTVVLYCGIAIYTLVNVSTYVGSMHPKHHHQRTIPQLQSPHAQMAGLQFARKNPPQVYYVRRRSSGSSWWNVLYHTVSVYAIAAWAWRRLRTTPATSS